MNADWMRAERVRQALGRACVAEVQEVRIGSAKVGAPVAAAPGLVAALDEAGLSARVQQ